MNKYRTITVLLLAVLWAAASQAQNPMIHFGYDANGNRTSRTLSMRKIEENGKAIDTATMPAILSETTDTFGQCTIALYPNPTHGIITVALQGMGETAAVMAEIVTASGSIIQRQELTTGSLDFDLSGLPPGIYLLHLTASEVSRTWKIIKQ